MTVEEVNASALSLQSRATVAIDTLESRKSIFGYLTGNNTTVEQTQGALRMIRDTQIPKWRNNGIDIALNGPDDKIAGWVSVGQDFAKAITEIDGYGEDATLQNVLASTTTQTITDVKEKVVVPALIGGTLVLIIAGILAVAYIVYSAKGLKA